MSKYHSTIWVCVCCTLSHANGECCADDAHGGDYMEPWAAVDFSKFNVTMGATSSQHAEECREQMQSEDYFDCDCETDTYSTSQCDGCGSCLHGERHAFTLWSK